MANTRKYFLHVVVLLLCICRSGIVDDVFAQSSPPNAPVISKIGGKSVVLGETHYTNGGQQGQSTISLLIQGFAEAGSTVKIYNSGSLVGSTTAQSNGAFQKSVSVGEGTYSYTVTATNSAGTSPVSDPAVLTKVDTTAPTITAYNNSVWRGNVAWVRDELRELYGIVADSGSSTINSGIDFSRAAGQIVDNTAGGTVPGSMTDNGDNRIDFIPTNGYQSGSFTDAHNYTMTLTVYDKAGNSASGTNTFTIDYTLGYTFSVEYIYDPSHQTALNKGELGDGEPTNNTPRTVSSGGTNYGSGWVKYYQDMHVYTNPTKMIVKVNPATTSPYMEGPHLSSFVELTGSGWRPHWSTNNVHGIIGTDGMFQTSSFQFAKERVYYWCRINDSAFNRYDVRAFRFYTKSGPPPSPVITDPGIRRAEFSATNARVISSTSGTIGASNNNMVVYRWGTWPNNVYWKVVVPPAGTAYQNRANQYDHGDTFIDLNNNWQWDSGEPFKDFTKPATSDGASYTILNVTNQTIDQDSIYSDYFRVYDPAQGLTSAYTSTHYVYTVDTTYPTIDGVYASPAVEKNNVIYASLSKSPKIIVECDDSPFSSTHYHFFTFSYNDCKIELLDESNTVVNSSHTGTFSKTNLNASYAKGELDLTTIPGLAQGTYTVRVTVVDLFGNTTVESTKTLVVDSDSPTITALTPAPGATVSALPNFQSTLYDLSGSGEEGSSVAFASGDQAVGNSSYSQLRPLKVLGTAAANGQTLVLQTPLLNHKGANLAVEGYQFEAWEEGQSVKVDTVTVDDVNGSQVTLLGSGNLQDGTSYTVHYAVPYYHASNNVEKLSANPIEPISQDGMYVVQVQAVDKAGNTSDLISSYEFGAGQPTMFTNATGAFTMTVTPSPGLAGEPVEIRSDIIRTQSGDPVFDGTLVTVSGSFTITDADQDYFTPGKQVKTVGGRAIFHMLSTTVGSGTAHAEVGGAYSQPDASVEFMPNYPYGTVALQANSSSLTADGSAEVTISSQSVIRDTYGNLITATNCPHSKFVVTAAGFTILGADADPVTAEHEIIPDASGNLQVTLRAGTVAQSSTVTIASVTQSGTPLAPTASGSIGLTLLPGVPGQPFTLSTSDNELIAQTTETTVVTSDPIVDAYGNVVADGTPITVSIDHGNLISGGSPVTQMTAPTAGGVITVEVSAQNTPVGTATVTATSADLSQNGSLPISFVADHPFGSISFAAAPAAVVADGASYTTITTQNVITDQYGNQVGTGVGITISTSAGQLRAGSGDTWQAGSISVQTTGAGHISFQLQSTTVLETATVSAQSVLGSAQGTVDVAFVPGDPVQVISLQSDVPEVIAGSTDTATVSAELRDEFDHPVADGTSVTATITYADATFDTVSVDTTDGEFDFTVNANAGPVGVCTITVESGSASGSITIDFIPGAPDQNFSMSATPSVIQADGSAQTTVTSSVIYDAFGNIVSAGELITVSSDDGIIVTADADPFTPDHQVAVGAGGTISFTLQSSTVAHTVTVSGHSVRGNAMGSTTVTFRAGVPAGQITLTATPDTLIANSGSSSQIVSGVIYDSNGNVVPAGSEITVSVDHGSIITADANDVIPGVQVLSDATGKIRFDVSSDAASQVPLGDATVSVYGDGQPGDRAAGTATITMTHGNPYGVISLTAQSVPLVADGVSETVIISDPVYDQYGNPMTEGVVVTVSTSMGSILGDAADDISGKQALTDAAGSISFVLRAGTAAGTAEVTALSFMGTAQGQISVAVEADVPSGTISLHTDPDTLILDGISQSQITSDPIYDAYGNIVKDGTLITVSSTLGSIPTADADPLEPETQVATVGGVITFALSSAGGLIDTAFITASSVEGDATGSTAVSFIAGPPSGTVVFSATPSAIVADPFNQAPVAGVQTTTTIETTAYITDAGGNVAADGELFTLYTSKGIIVDYDTGLPFDDDPSIGGIQVAVDGGMIRFKLSSSGSPVGTATVHASSVSGTATGSTSVTFTDTGVADSISIILDEDRPDSNRYIPWNISRAVILQCFDRMGNRATGDTVTLKIIQNDAQGTLSGYTGYPGSGTTLEWNGQTDAQGRLLVTYTSPAYDAQRGDDLMDILDAQSASVADSEVDDRTFIVTTVVPPLFRMLNLPSTAAAGEFTAFQLEIIDEYDSHITSVDPSLEVVFTSSPANHQAVSDFYQFDSGSGQYIALGQGTANTLTWDVDGYATVYYRDTLAGDADIRVEDALGVVKAAHKPITIVMSLPTGYPALSLHAAPATIVGNGVSTSNITSDPVTDPYGNVISGAVYTVSVDTGKLLAADIDGDSLNGVQVATDASGIVSFSVRSSQTVATATVIAEALLGIASSSVSVDYVADVPSGSIVLNPSVNQVPADGSSTISVTSAPMYDQWGNIIAAGELITVDADLGTIITADADPVTDGVQVAAAADGTVSFTVRSSLQAGVEHISASSVRGTASGSVDVMYLPGDPAGFIVLHANPSSVVANSPNSSQITSDPITDGTNIVQDGTLFTVSAQRGSIVALDQSTTIDGIQVKSRNGVISFVFNPNTGVGTVLIEAQSVVGSSYGSVEITLTGAGDLYGPITLHADPSVMVADGQSTTTITSDQLTDRYGNIIAEGTPVDVAVTSGTINATGQSSATVTTGANGILTFTVTGSTIAGTAAVSAQNSAGTASGSIDITYTPGEPSGVISLQASPLSLVAKSGAQSTIRVPNDSPITDQFGNIVADGTPITVSTTRGKLVVNSTEVTQATVTTTSGLFTVLLRATADADIGTAQITASGASAGGTAVVQFVPGSAAGTISLIASPAQITANGASVSTITSSPITDQYGTVVADGTQVQVSTGRGTLLDMSDTTLAGPVVTSGGVISFKLRSSTVAGVASIGAQSVAGSASGTTSVTFTPDVPAGTFTLIAVPSGLIAKSSQTSTVTSGVIRDANGNAVGAGVEVLLTATSGMLSDGQGSSGSTVTLLTRSDSTVQGTFTADTSTEPGTVSITGQSVDGSAQTSQALLIELKSDRPAGAIQLYASPAQIVADGQSTSHITSDPITDQYGNTINAGTLVTVIPTWGTIVEPDADPVTYQHHQIAVDADGQLSFHLTSETKVGVCDITATTPTGTATGAIQVTGVPGTETQLVVVLPGETFDTSEPGLKTGLPADQVINSPFTVKVYPVDQFGNHVIGSTMEVELIPMSIYTHSSPGFVQSFDGSTGELAFSVEDTIAGMDVTISANDTVTGSVTGTSSAFEILAGAAVKLQLLLPGQTPVPGDPGDGIDGAPLPQQAGLPFDVIVNVVDSYYNVVTTTGGTVELSSSGVGAVMPENTVLSNGSVVLSVTETTLSTGANRVLTANMYPDTGGDPLSSFSSPFEVLDTQAPQLLSFTINDGAPYTGLETVDLAIDAVDAAGSAISMRFKNEDGSWSDYEPYASSVSGYQLSDGYGSKTIYVQLRDARGNESSVYSASIMRATPPNADAGTSYTVSEGMSFQLDASLTTDIDPGDILSYAWDIDGDGEFDDATGVSPAVSFDDDYTGTVSVQVTDSFGLSDTASASLTVLNVDPSVSVPGADTTRYELVGSSIGIAPITVTDPGIHDSFTAVVAWSTGVQETIPVTGNSFTAAHTYGESGVYTVQITVQDDDGGAVSQSITLDVSHAPVADAGGDYTADEGATVTFDASATADQDGVAGLTYRWDIDGDGDYDENASGVTWQTSWDDDYTGTVTVHVTDPKGFSSTASAQVVITNVDPVLDVDTAQIVTTLAEGGTVSLSDGVSFTDAGAGDTHSVVVAWGGSEGDDTIGTAGQGPVSLSHTYSHEGIYSVTIEVQDDDGGVDSASFDVQVGIRPIDVSIVVEDDRSVKLMFVTVPDKVYSVIYCDNDSILNDNTLAHWQTAASVIGDGDVHTPDTFIDTGDGDRVSPGEVAVRYYRVVRQDAISQGVYQVCSDIAYVRNVVLYEGRNFVGAQGSDDTLARMLDPRFLRGGITPTNSSIINFWDGFTSKRGYVFFDGADSRFWLDAVSGAELYDDYPISDVSGCMVTIPPATGTIVLPKAGLIKKHLPVEPRPVQTGSYTMVSWPFARAASLSECGFIDSGFKGSLRARTSDMIYFWNPQTQRYDLPVFYFSGTGEWRYYDQSPCTRKIQPGEAVLIRTQPDSTFTQWSIGQMPYPEPASTIGE